MSGEIYLDEIEVEILQVFIKRKILENLMISVALEDLIDKLNHYKSN